MMPPQIETMKKMQKMMLEMHSTQSSQQDQQHAMNENQSAMGDAFNDSHNDDTFYLPPEIFDNKDFKRGMDNFISPDGHAVRFIISHENDPLSADGIERIDAIKNAAFDAIKGTPLEGSQGLPRRHRVHLQGHAGRQQLRPADRRRRRADADLHRHAAHHAQRRRSRRHRRHRGAVARRVLRAVGSVLAAPDGLGPASSW